MGFEPTTASLEGWNSTTELRPPIPFFSLAFSINFLIARFKSISLFQSVMVGRQGFEPWKPMAADLQSAPVDRLGTCPFERVGPYATKPVCELHHGIKDEDLFEVKTARANIRS